MKRLPFKNDPKPKETILIGNADIGQLDIPKYGQLTPNEYIFIEKHTAHLPNIKKEAAILAQSLSAATGISPMQVFEALSENNLELLQNHLAEVMSFNDLYAKENAGRKIVEATCILKFRVLRDWEIEDTLNGDLHPLLIEELAQFLKKEQSGWETPKLMTEEDLGKSERTMEPAIGEKSIGESINTIPTTNDLALITSGISQ